MAGVVVVVLEGRKEERVGGRGGRKKKEALPLLLLLHREKKQNFAARETSIESFDSLELPRRNRRRRSLARVGSVQRDRELNEERVERER